MSERVLQLKAYVYIRPKDQEDRQITSRLAYRFGDGYECSYNDTDAAR
jgi:hypothetical protein